MPVVTFSNGVELKNYYYNNTNDDNYNTTIEHSLVSFFVSLCFMCLLIQVVRCCVKLSRKYNKKNQYRILDRFNVNREGVNEECPICLETVSEKIVLHCNHAFNKKCFYQWVETSIQNNSFKCPLCNVVYTIN